MDNQNNLTDQTLSDGAQLTPADGATAVDTNSLSLAELNSHLGKDFKDKASALKAVKDTFSFVGKRIEPAPAADDTSKAELQALKEQAFYLENPQFKEMKSIIQKMGGNPAEVVGTEEFKSVFEAMKVAGEVSKTRTVLQSNPRLAQQKSQLDAAIQLSNSRNASTMDVANALAAAILEDAAN